MSDEARERLREVARVTVYEMSVDDWSSDVVVPNRILDALTAHLSEHPEDAEGLGARRIDWGWIDETTPVLEQVGRPDDPQAQPVFAWPKER